MTRAIPIQLRESLQSDATTTTLLLRIDPVDPRFPSYGVAKLDRDVVYNDGDGELTYLAAIGMVPASVAYSSSLAVDNSEFSHLIPEFDVPVNEADIRAGAYDFAGFRLMLVNYEDLTQGHVTLLEGTIGQVKINDDGLSFATEFRSLTAQLKQSLCEKDSLGCRAIFGSQPVGSSTPGPQVQFGWCGYPAEDLLIPATVLAVGLESTLSFQVDVTTSMETDQYAPGMVFFQTGLNAGRSFEIESNTDDGWITLQFETGFPIQVGDTLEYREDCSKMARDDAKGCRHWFETEWVLHFRGEPDIPVADEGALQTPGAMVGPGGGGTTSVPFNDA